jgi:uncharacterized membrane protein
VGTEAESIVETGTEAEGPEIGGMETEVRVSRGGEAVVATEIIVLEVVVDMGIIVARGREVEALADMGIIACRDREAGMTAVMAAIVRGVAVEIIGKQISEAMGYTETEMGSTEEGIGDGLLAAPDRRMRVQLRTEAIQERTGSRTRRQDTAIEIDAV